MSPQNLQSALRSDGQKLLVRSVNWLGDAVMSMPALERLREARPNSHITLLVHEKLASLWQNHPALDQVMTFAPGDTVLAVARRLRREKFSCALLLPNSPRAALEAFFARIPERVGYARPWRNSFLTQAVPPRPGAFLIKPRSINEIRTSLTGSFPPPFQFDPRSHHLHDYLQLVAALGAKSLPIAPRLQVSPEELADATALLPCPALNTGWFGLNPGAEYGPAKRWPAERFVEAAVEIHRQTGCGWLLLGGTRDLDLTGSIESAIRRECAAPLQNLAGRTTLRQLCAVLKLCRVVLTNDTGPMHLAAAVDTPVVVPFGSTSPELTGPGLPGTEKHLLLKADVPCSPCFRHSCPIDFRCMQAITVAQVVTAVLRLIPK